MPTFTTKKEPVTTRQLVDFLINNIDLPVFIGHWENEFPTLNNIWMVRLEEGRIIIAEGDVKFRSKGNGWEATR